MTTRTRYHTDTATEFLVKARSYLGAGDLLQASEKGWGAAARMVKAVAEERGWRHGSHGDLYRAVGRISEELSDKRIRTLFASANALHQNFYEGWMPEDAVEQSLDEVEEFADRLADLIA